MIYSIDRSIYWFTHDIFVDWKLTLKPHIRRCVPLCFHTQTQSHTHTPYITLVYLPVLFDLILNQTVYTLQIRIRSNHDVTVADCPSICLYLSTPITITYHPHTHTHVISISKIVPYILHSIIIYLNRNPINSRSSYADEGWLQSTVALCYLTI